MVCPANFVQALPESRIATLLGDPNIRVEGGKSFKIGQDLDGRIVDRVCSDPLFHRRLLRLWVGIL